MDPSIDLEQTITDAVNDAQLDQEPEAEVADTPSYEVDTSTETPTETPDAPVAPQEALEDTPFSAQVSSPAAQTTDAQAAPKDDFEALAGMPQMGVGGRENRIPYSRVKKITSKAVGDAVEGAIGRKLNPNENPIEAVKKFATEVGTLRNEHQEYTKRLDAVGQFENLMVNTPDQFLKKLAELPQYEPFFNFLDQAYTAYEANGNTWGPAAGNPQLGSEGQAQVVQQPVVATEVDPMPEPDELLSDGSRQYSMDGIRQLLDWNSKRVTDQVSKDITKRFEERYGPIEKDWKSFQRKQEMLPIVQKQISEAMQWPMFKELQPEIEALLEQDQNISLETAYRTIAFPRILAERSKIKQDVINEMQRAPNGNSASTPRVASRPNQPAAIPEGPNRLEAIIAAEVEKLRR